MLQYNTQRGVTFWSNIKFILKTNIYYCTVVYMTNTELDSGHASFSLSLCVKALKFFSGDLRASLLSIYSFILVHSNFRVIIEHMTFFAPSMLIQLFSGQLFHRPFLSPHYSFA